MRCHFAIPFIDKTVTDKSVTRTTNIRKAFNSPFVRSCFQQPLSVRKVLIFIGMPERLFTGTFLPILWIWSNVKVVSTALSAWPFVEMW